MDGPATQERVRTLRLEIADIRKDNQEYLRSASHSEVAEREHKEREMRLVRIMEELSGLALQTKRRSRHPHLKPPG